MFLAHFGLGLAGIRGVSRQAPRPSLGTLFMAAQWLDLIWPLFLLFGWETVKIDPGNTALTPLDFESYPYSHSLLMAAIWGVLFGGVYFVIRRHARPALVLGLLVVSHWVLDLLVHRPDLPLLPWGDSRVGLGLWNSVPLSIALEALIFGGGAWIYIKTTHAGNRTGRFALWGLLAFLAVVYLGNVFGPPPDAVKPIAIVGLAQWLLIAWGYWIDLNRTLINGSRR